MNTTAIATLSIFSYLIGTLLIIRHINQSRIPRTALYLAWTAVSTHLIYMAIVFQQNDGFNFNFFSTSSLVAMIVALLLLIATINKPVEKLGIALFPIAASMLALDLNFSHKTPLVSHYNWALSTHILTSIIAFSLLNIAAIQAILLAIQDQQLKSHPPKRFIQSLPPLQTMESLLFQMLTTGIVFLSISLASGSPQNSLIYFGMAYIYRAFNRQKSIRLERQNSNSMDLNRLYVATIGLFWQQTGIRTNIAKIIAFMS
ncbi:MAG: hypothetical protein RIQ94_1614 [Pseudomonadota bacterium]